MRNLKLPENRRNYFRLPQCLDTSREIKNPSREVRRYCRKLLNHRRDLGNLRHVFESLCREFFSLASIYNILPQNNLRNFMTFNR